MPTLSDALVRRLLASAGSSREEVADDKVPGFRARVSSNGVAFFLRYRSASGQQRNPKLGDYPTLSVAAARELALDWRAAIRQGQDPSAHRQRRRAAATIADLAERFMTEHASVYCKPSTIVRYAGIIRMHILPQLGTAKIEDVTRADVETLHRKVGKVGKGSANRTVQLLSVMLTKAEDWGLRPEGRNACRGIKRFAERTVERFLSPEERARLDEVIAHAMTKKPGEPGHVSHDCLVLFRLLSATGARKSEIMDLTWPMVDLERKQLRLPDSKTGQKVIQLSPQALAILAGIKRRGLLVVATANDTPLNSRNVHRSWDTIRKRAGLADVRLHDLRHSAASDAIMAGVPLELVGGLLGHKHARTTQRYRHLSDEVLRQAAEMMGRAIEENTARGVNVVSMRRSP